MSEPLEYVRNYYGVPAVIGRRVTVDGKPGIITEEMGAYIGVNFDGTKATAVMPCHPTWKVEYLEMGTLPKLTRGQKQWMEYSKVRDCFENFREFLRYKQQQRTGA